MWSRNLKREVKAKLKGPWSHRKNNNVFQFLCQYPATILNSVPVRNSHVSIRLLFEGPLFRSTIAKIVSSFCLRLASIYILYIFNNWQLFSFRNRRGLHFDTGLSYGTAFISCMPPLESSRTNNVRFHTLMTCCRYGLYFQQCDRCCCALWLPCALSAVRVCSLEACSTANCVSAE
jgi:hypothetical protein